MTDTLDTCNVPGYAYRVAIRSFRHKGLRKFFTDGSRAGIRPEHAARLRVILGRMAVAETLEDLNLPGLRLHPMQGDQAGRWALDVSGNWRVTFRFDHHDITEVDYEDYH